jgi:hypothetical protein
VRHIGTTTGLMPGGVVETITHAALSLTVREVRLPPAGTTPELLGLAFRSPPG